MHRALLLLVAALVAVSLSLLPASTAHAKRCAKGTTAVGPVSKPTACVPARVPSQVAALQQAVAAASKPVKVKGKKQTRGKRSARASKLLQQVLAFAQERVAAGEPVFETRATRAARASGNATVTNAPASFGKQISTSVDSAGNVTSQFRTGDLTVEMGARQDEISIDIRDRSGAGGFARFDPGSAKTPRCPTSAGDVPSAFDTRMTIGEATAAHGKRTVTAITVIVDGPWHGYVGVGAKAERFDLALRGAMEARLWVEIAATGKVLEREPTRTYRAVLDRKGIAIGTPGQAVVGGARLYGPKGSIKSSLDRTLSSSLASLVVTHVDLVTDALKTGDERWYDRRMCARTFVDSYRPDQVAKGDTASWKVRVISDFDGQPAADAIWTPTSTCGAVSAETTRGATMSASVADAAGTWGPDPYAPGCISAEVTSTAGRAATFAHTIEPKKPDGLRFTITVTYNEFMGSGIAETNMTGTGTVFLPWNATDAEGSGSYQGTEWDGTIANPCGEDMARSRGFSGKAVVGVHRNRDGTFSVAFTAAERPLRMSFLAIVPADGGVQSRTGAQPFCGQAGLAKTATELKVTSVAVPAE